MPMPCPGMATVYFGVFNVYIVSLDPATEGDFIVKSSDRTVFYAHG